MDFQEIDFSLMWNGNVFSELDVWYNHKVSIILPPKITWIQEWVGQSNENHVVPSTVTVRLLDKWHDTHSIYASVDSRLLETDGIFEHGTFLIQLDKFSDRTCASVLHLTQTEVECSIQFPRTLTIFLWIWWDRRWHNNFDFNTNYVPVHMCTQIQFEIRHISMNCIHDSSVAMHTNKWSIPKAK